MVELFYEWIRPQRKYHAKANADLGRCPEPVKLRRRRKRVSRDDLRRERVAEASYAARIKSRIYLAERAAGNAGFPKDSLWKLEGTAKDLWRWLTTVSRRTGQYLTPWRYYDDAYIRAYLYRDGSAFHITCRREGRPSFLTWVRRVKPKAAIKKENNDLLWAALRVLCYKRAWPRGIPKANRKRLLFQARHVLTAENPLIKLLK
jgi:hypothetical protein